MLSRETAIELAEAGVIWQPHAGDRFIVRADEMADEVFHLSDMTIDVGHYPEGAHVRFNGTTEWALDSIEIGQTVWLPHEGQLRALLGDRLRSLTKEGDDWVVEIDHPEGARRLRHRDVEEAYAAALLAL